MSEEMIALLIMWLYSPVCLIYLRKKNKVIKKLTIDNDILKERIIKECRKTLEANNKILLITEQNKQFKRNNYAN